MRRTVFVAPVETAAVLQAACSREVAARERRKLEGFVAASELASDGAAAAWLAGAEKAALASLAAWGEATAADLAADPWGITTPPANVNRLLARASQMVRGATKTALYATDDDGMPTDSDVLSGFRDATCAQVSAWITAGIDDPSGGT